MTQITGSSAPFFIQESAEEKRKSQLAQALMGNALQFNPNHQSWLGPLSQALAGGFGMYMQNKANDQYNDRRGAATQTMQDALSAYRGDTTVPTTSTTWYDENRPQTANVDVPVRGEGQNFDAFIDTLKANKDTAPAAVDYQMSQVESEMKARNNPFKGIPAKSQGSTEGFFIADPDNPGEAIMMRHPETGEPLLPSYADPEARERFTKSGAEGVSNAKLSDEAFTSIDNIRGNIRNLKEGLRLVEEEGASTGWFADMMPTIRAGSIKLKNVQRRLGLDIIGSVTFGALSKGELDLALAVGLPLDLDENEIVPYMKRKIAAQEKLANYYEEQITYFNGPNASKDGWLNMIKARKEGRDKGDPLGLR